MPKDSKKQKVSKKPNLYQGQPLPLADLTPDSFEDFAHQVLIELGKGQEFEIISGPLNSSDHGFDLVGRRTSDKNLMCIQCKRYNSSSVGLPIVGEELAKVAINSHLEGSSVKEHYVLTTGSLTKDLNSQLRSKKRNKILETGIKSLEKDSFKSLIKECEKQGADAVKIVTNYINTLEKIIVWSGRDFDNNLGTIWSAIEDAIEKHFKLERVLSEYPRPNFNLTQYTNEIVANKENLLQLIAVPTVLPPNISKIEPDGFDKRLKDELESNGNEPLIVDSLLSLVPRGHSMLLVGHGGAGKTTSLIHFQEVLLKELENNEESEVPIYIKIAGFRTNLDDLIHGSLGITHGHWSSLPYRFFLLLDGLDEINTDDINLFASQVTRKLKRNNVKAIISLRNAGLQLPVTMPSVSGCYSLRRLNFRQIIRLSESLLNKKDSTIFIETLLSRANSIGAESFTLPFGLKAALDYFQTNKNLPDNLYDIIIDIIERRIRRNKNRRSSIDPSINLVSESTVNALSESLAFEVRVVQKKAALYQQEAESAVVAALKRVKEQDVFGASSLSDDIAFFISVHYEMQRKNSNGLYVMDHDLISDCLSAKLLAKLWKDYIDKAGDKIGWDAWTFASRFVPDSEKNEFIQRMINQNLALAARCCKEMEGRDQKSIERVIESNAKDSSLGVFANAMYAASILKSVDSLKLLNKCLSEKDPNRKYNAQKFLSISGDEKFLRYILEDNERAKAGGLNPSGGTFDMWFRAPVKTVTKIAREQIDQYLLGNVPYVPIALETLELYGDNSDFDRVKAVFIATENLTEFYISSRCLLAFDADRAVKLLRSRANDLEGKFWLYAMNVLNGHGSSFNIAPLFREFVSTLELASTGEIHAFKDIAKILSSNTLPANAAAELLKLLDTLDLNKDECSGLHQFYNIWKIATAQKYDEFEDKALEQLDGGTIPEVLVSLTYGSELFVDGPKNPEFVKKCLVQLELKLGDEMPQFSLIRKLFKVLIDFGELNAVIRSAEKLLSEHTSKYFQILKCTEQEQKSDLYYKYKFEFSEILNSLIDIKHELDPKLLVDLVGINVCHNSKETKHAYGEIIRLLPRDVAEIKISQLKEPFIKIESLGCLLTLEKSDSTKGLFIENIPLMLTHHFYYPTLTAFSKVYWSDEVRKELIETVAQFEWDLHQVLMQSFQKVMEELAYLFNQNDIKMLLIPAMNSTNNQFTIYLIKLWIDFIKN